MTKKEAIQRWANPDFMREMTPVLEQIFVEKAPVFNVNCAGITVGSQSPIGLYNVGLYQKKITNSDFSFSTFECAFSGSTILETSFRNCSFESTSFQKSMAIKCSFVESSIKGGGCNDSVFEECDFTGAKMRDKSSLPLSFLRARFNRCDFTNAVINGVEFRAATFEECVFGGTLFTNCDLRGVKFLGTRPDSTQIGKGCTLT
jgi:uncharacterized protein YjbI with pentapeptide repeats